MDSLCIQLDEVYKQIIKCLQNGRRAFSSIAEELDITKNTVRSRVNKMIEEGILEITGLVDPQAISGQPGGYHGHSGCCHGRGCKGREISQLRAVISVGLERDCPSLAGRTAGLHPDRLFQQ